MVPHASLQRDRRRVCACLQFHDRKRYPHRAWGALRQFRDIECDAADPAAATGLGAQLFFAPNWSLLVKFDSEFASASQTYAGSGTLRYTW
jgi:hypothetical protein